MIQVILDMQNPEFVPTMLGTVFDKVFYTLHHTTDIKSNFSNTVCSEIDRSNYISMDEFVAFLAVLVAQCGKCFFDHGGILL